MKHILALHTGGTISMTENAAGAVVPSTNNPMMAVPAQLQDITVSSEEIFNLPSPHVTPEKNADPQQAHPPG